MCMYDEIGHKVFKRFIINIQAPTECKEKIVIEEINEVVTVIYNSASKNNDGQRVIAFATSNDITKNSALFSNKDPQICMEVTRWS